MKPPVFDPSWDDEVKAVYTHDLQEIWDPGLAPHVWNQYHNQLSLYQSQVPAAPCRILDVGCAQATLAMQLAEQGHSVTAMDLRQPFLDYAASRFTHGNINFTCADALKLELEPIYDVIFANQIIEHLIYPLELLQKLRSGLIPGGALIITTPNHDYFRNSLPSFSELGDPDDYQHLQNTADADGHFYAYTSAELEKLFRQAHFKAIKTIPFETPFISGHSGVRHFVPFLPRQLMRWLDRATLKLHPVAPHFAHQLLVRGER
jgi:2-polyprenyl-3-methyl-5-hydroxy-6-metoxy-1,4-benzoquinol methylase